MEFDKPIEGGAQQAARQGEQHAHAGGCGVDEEDETKMIMCPRCGSVLEMSENRRNEIIKTLNSREVRCPRCFNGRWAAIYRDHAITDRELADAFAVMRED